MRHRQLLSCGVVLLLSAQAVLAQLPSALTANGVSPAPANALPNAPLANNPPQAPQPASANPAPVLAPSPSGNSAVGNVAKWATPTPVTGWASSNPCAPACCPDAKPASDAWVSAEYLYWVTRGMHVPPLVTTSPAGTAQAAAGVLGAGGTTLFGNSNLNNDWQSGFRVSAGVGLSDGVGIVGSFFYLDDQDTNFRAASTGTPILARPFINAVTGAPASELVAFPGLVAGSVHVSGKTQLLGADGNLSCCVVSGCGYQVQALGGFRYLRLHDELTIREDLLTTSTAALTPPGTRITVQDGFRTSNNFYGGQVGLAGRFGDDFFVDVVTKVALGCTDSEIDVAGRTTAAVPGATAVTNVGGLLAQRTNSGSRDRSNFAVVPEAILRVGYRITSNVSVTAGYTFLYCSNVYRAGEQIDPRVNPTQIPPGTLVGPARPAFLARETDFWAQGFSAGLEIRW